MRRWGEGYADADGQGYGKGDHACRYPDGNG
jgi:hypothetical protein